MQGLVTTQPLHFALLQNAKQLDLNITGNIANFIQHDGSGIGLLELAGFRHVRAGECSFFVAEQLALHQIFGKRGAVDFDEWLVFARRVEVDGAGDQIFTYTTFSGQQHSGAGRSDAHH